MFIWALLSHYLLYNDLLAVDSASKKLHAL